MNLAEAQGPLPALFLAHDQHFQGNQPFGKISLILVLVGNLIVSNRSRPCLDAVSQGGEENRHSFVLGYVEHA